MQPCCTQLERKLMARLSSAIEMDHLRAPGSRMYELHLTCLEYAGLERLAKSTGRILDALVRGAVTKAVDVPSN